ncbi:MAG: signal peptidase II [Fidelibacterota bacterium]
MKVLLISAVMVLIDQGTKAAVRGSMTLQESIPVIPKFFHLTYITNDGMAFGINIPFGIIIFSIVSVIFTVFLIWYLWKNQNQRRMLKIGIALILAGAVGNLIDRLVFGKVVDFLDFMLAGHHWYIFNIADSCVTVGMGLVILDSLIFERKKPILSH